MSKPENQIDLFQSTGVSSETPAAFANPSEGLSGSVSEWIEVFAFLKLLADGRVTDSYLDSQNKKMARRMVVISVIREHPEPCLYHVAARKDTRRKSDDIHVHPSDGQGGFASSPVKVVDRAEIKLAVEALVEVLAVKNGSDNKESFTLPMNHPTMTLLKSLGWKVLKREGATLTDVLRLTTSKVTDRLNRQTLSYRVRSATEEAPSFGGWKERWKEYEVCQVSRETPPLEEAQVEAINKTKGRLSWLNANGYRLKGVTKMPKNENEGCELFEIFEHIFVPTMLGACKGVVGMNDVLDMLKTKDPLDWMESHGQEVGERMYKKILKKTLLDMSLGFDTKNCTATSTKDGAPGGVLVVGVGAKNVLKVDMHSEMCLKQMEEANFQATNMEIALHHEGQILCKGKSSKEWKMLVGFQVRLVKVKFDLTRKPPVQKQEKLGF
jgi:HpaII restriction endonuclease